LTIAFARRAKQPERALHQRAFAKERSLDLRDAAPLPQHYRLGFQMLAHRRDEAHLCGAQRRQIGKVLAAAANAIEAAAPPYIVRPCIQPSAPSSLKRLPAGTNRAASAPRPIAASLCSAPSTTGLSASGKSCPLCEFLVCAGIRSNTVIREALYANVRSGKMQKISGILCLPLTAFWPERAQGGLRAGLAASWGCL